MKKRFLSKSKRQIGIVIVLVFTGNIIMLSASLSFLSSGEQSLSTHSSVNKYDNEKINDMGVNLKPSAIVKEEKIRKNNFRLNSFSKSIGQMDFIPASRTKFFEDKKGQMDLEPPSRAGFNKSNEEYLDFKSPERKGIGKNDSIKNEKLFNKKIDDQHDIHTANNKHVLEEINALANKDTGRVYHMYDDDVPVFKGNVGENLVQKKYAIQGIPKSFDENYIKYFWNHPEFREMNNLKVERDPSSFQDKTTGVKSNGDNVKDKPNVTNTKQEILTNNDKKNRVNHNAHVNENVKKEETYVTMSPARGQLGNQIFQLASLIGIAEKRNFTPFLQTSQFELEQVFRFPKKFSRVIDTSTFKIFSESNYTQDVSLKLCQKLNSYKNWSLDGWFQSFKYFEDVSEQVRHYLRFKKDLMHTALEFKQKMVPHGHTSVAVHVRRRDFISAYEMKLGRVEVPSEYFQRAMKYFLSKFKNVTFVVVSDDIRWCKEYIKGDNVVYSTFYHNDKGVDLALISHCDHVIVSVGTFGWWGGWLSRGIVVYYKKFPTPGSKLDKMFVPRNYYPVNWIPLE